MSEAQIISLKGLGKFARFQLTANELIAKGEAKARAVYDNFFGTDWDHNTLDDFRSFIPGLDLEQRSIAERHARLQARVGVRAVNQARRTAAL